MSTFTVVSILYFSCFSGPPKLLLQGAKKAKHNGTYMKVQKEDCECRPVYEHSTENYYFYYNNCGWKMSEVAGGSSCYISVTSDASSPDQVLERWQEGDGGRYVDSALTVQCAGGFRESS